MQRAERTTIIKRKAYEESEYDILLSEAIKLGRQHKTKAKYYVPKMYAILLKEGLAPVDAADRIYKDLVGIWQKDTIRRLLPPEVKNQVARERQALSRRSIAVNKAGLILHNDNVVIELERENARLRKRIEELNDVNRSNLGKILRLEKATSSKVDPQQNQEGKATTIMLPPRLFMKTYTLMRSCLKPLVLKVDGKEVIDIDRIG